MLAFDVLTELRALGGRFGLIGNRGIQLEASAASRVDAERFLGFLAQCVADLPPSAGHVLTDGIDELAETGVSWRRQRFCGVFPLLVERLRVVAEMPEGVDLGPEGVPFAQATPGVWVVPADAIAGDQSDFMVRGNAWRNRLRELATSGTASGGLSVNVLKIPAADLQSGRVDLRPTVLRNFDAEHRCCDLRSLDDQARVANAFWQTYWATGALRAERGTVFPVAFLPVDRNHPFEFFAPFTERYVTLRRRLFGRTSILSYVLESLTRARALFVDPRSGVFLIDPLYDPATAEWTATAADVALALEELERTGWVDRFTGGNKDQFDGMPAPKPSGQPWPFGTGAGVKIRAKGPAEDFLRSRRLTEEVEGRAIRIHRVVPYQAASTLGQVFHDSANLAEIGKLPDLGGKIIAGTNSTFFLNFPEEYANVHSALNDSVSALVENGATRQLKTMRRAAFVLAEDGRAIITTKLGNRMESEVLIFEGEGVTATAVRGAGKAPGANKVGPLFFGAVVVGGSIVETFEESAGEVPMNGWITGDSEAFGGKLDPVGAVRVSLVEPGSVRETPIRHAFAVGPLLVEGGQTVAWGRSREEFEPFVGPPGSAVETADLARSEIPASSAAAKAGLPPTRFPHDGNQTRAPRTAIGVTSGGDVVLAVVDGRASMPHSVGVSLDELAVVMKGLGCVDALNLDGGGSSVMYLRPDIGAPFRLRDDLRPGVVNLPSDLGGVERLLPVPLLIIRRD